MWQGSVLEENDLLPSSMSSKIQGNTQGWMQPDVTGEIKSCPALHSHISMRKVSTNS